MKYSIVLAGMVIAVLSTGCMSGYYAHREHRRVVQEDTLMTPPMTVDDVIAMAKDGVSDDVILAQMKATHSVYRLTSNDIRDLKKNGVSDKVVNAMIRSAEEANVAASKVVREPYPDYYYWNPYPYPYFYDPWYSGAYIGFNYGWGHYGRMGFGFGRGFRGRR